MGGDESWGPEAEPEDRWVRFEQSACKDSMEMRGAVSRAVQATIFVLGERDGGCAVRRNTCSW